jgi:membrane protease YdiL (CAAX protease family)
MNPLNPGHSEAAPLTTSGPGFQTKTVSLSWIRKFLSIRSLEYFLVLFALVQTGIFTRAFFLLHNGLSPKLRYPKDINSWIYYFIRYGSGLVILGYVLFRNSRWGQMQAGAEEVSIQNCSSTVTRGIFRIDVFELFMVLFVAFGAFSFHSLSVLAGKQIISDGPIVSSFAKEAYEVLFDFGQLAFLGYVLGRSRRGFQDLGLFRSSRDVAVALPLAMSAVVVFMLLLPLAAWATQRAAGHQVHIPNVGNMIFGNGVSTAAVFSQITNGFYEELIVRAYLMTEVKRITGSVVFAIFCSVTIQVSYHLYQGLPLAISHIGGFLVFALYYAKTYRILPVAIAHAATDLNSLAMYLILHP